MQTMLLALLIMKGKKDCLPDIFLIANHVKVV